MNKTQTINVYSDESRHLRGQANYMVIGAVWCADGTRGELTDKVKLLKRQYGISRRREIKWTKVSPAKIDYYRALIKLFFETEGLNFRSIVIPTQGLRHEDFDQTEDEFYYKMQYAMLSNIIRKYMGKFRIYLDYKDTWSNMRTQKLVSFLHSNHEYKDRAFAAQPIRSMESTPMQLADLLIGAVAYANNESNGSGPKAELVRAIESYAGQSLNDQTPFGVDKFNIFKWHQTR